MKQCLSILLLLFSLASFGQSKKGMPRDKIWLKTGDTETGKVVDSDSTSILLRKNDYSSKTILWSDIDTITGQSYKTFFVSPFLGLGDINYFSTFRYEKVSSSGMLFGARLGYMKRKRLSTYMQFIEMPIKPYNVFKTSIGVNYHLIKDYTKHQTLYVGSRFEMNNVKLNNKPFFNYVLQWGVEFMTKNHNRFFTELSYQKTIFNVHNGSGINFTFGIRFGKEYKPFYKRLNTLRKL